MHYVMKTEQLNQILLPLEAELAQIWAEEQCQAQEYEALLNIKTYSRQVLKKSADLQPKACVTAARWVPKHIWAALQKVREQVALR
ncbi:hypothetical protein QTO34_005885 [Cnephaeus nilssonii]|uniref:Uncharacterized protein n=1 Tax=Cnephaeus nilssonii TaxID=3371016 RepID=A0AA40HMT2_CNENI|nr:hypothetical protein QTO34_005885 [Eptesicus nilssonii]